MANKILKIWTELKFQLVAVNAGDVTLTAIEATLNQQCRRALSFADKIRRFQKSYCEHSTLSSSKLVLRYQLDPFDNPPWSMRAGQSSDHQDYIVQCELAFSLSASFRKNTRIFFLKNYLFQLYPFQFGAE